MGDQASERWRLADESVAGRFTWSMNAATWRHGWFCDIIFAFVMSGMAALGLAVAVHAHVTWIAWGFGAMTAFPLIGCLVANVMMRNARVHVVAWIASMPFPVENINALLLGMGEMFEIHFVSSIPARTEIMEDFAQVSDDVFVLETRDDERMMVCRFGVIASKHNPHRLAYGRYARLRQLAERSLGATHEKHPIARVRIV